MKINSIQCLGGGPTNTFVFETPQRSAAALKKGQLGIRDELQSKRVIFGWERKGMLQTLGNSPKQVLARQ